MLEILNQIDGIIWGPFVLIPLLLGTGIWLTVRLGGVQFTKLVPALRLAFLRRGDGDDEQGDVSDFHALSRAPAATVGVGNSAGVATAIHLGGPGALFWMWTSAIFGMAAKYSEAFMGVRFRTVDAKGEMNGGPQHYLAKAIPNMIRGWGGSCFTTCGGSTTRVGPRCSSTAVSATGFRFA